MFTHVPVRPHGFRHPKADVGLPHRLQEADEELVLSRPDRRATVSSRIRVGARVADITSDVEEVVGATRDQRKGIEVLVLHDRIDEWMMSNLLQYQEKSFQDVARGELLLDDDESKAEQKEKEKLAADAESIVERLKAVLSERVEDVRVSTRLTSSPACLVLGADDMGAHMRQIMAAAGQAVPATKPVFEINPEHFLIKKLDQEADDDRFSELTDVLFDQAKLAQGENLSDPATYVTRINKLLSELGA